MAKKSRKKLFDGNATGGFKLSRSKLDLFIECSRCFYHDRKLGIARPPSLPFTLNSAVDALLKKEFDTFRAKGKAHPLMTAHGINAVPFRHPDLDTWRSNFKGISFSHPGTDMTIHGAVDDVWVKPDGSLIIADYKATSTKEEISLESGYKSVFKRQLEVYQWLFRRNGFTVDPVACLVYANALKSADGLNGNLPFEMSILKYKADDSWMEDAITRAHECLAADRPPEPAETCACCAYVKNVTAATS